MELGCRFGSPPLEEALPPVGKAEVCKISLLCICKDAGGHPEVGLEHHGLPGGAESPTAVAPPRGWGSPGGLWWQPRMPSHTQAFGIRRYGMTELFKYRFRSGALISQARLVVPVCHSLQRANFSSREGDG